MIIVIQKQILILLTHFYKYVVVNVLKRHSSITGDLSKGATPVLIPNTEVKTFSAEDTCVETRREPRSLPVFPNCTSIEVLFLFCYYCEEYLEYENVILDHCASLF